MWLKWRLWKYVVRRLALSHGFADPITVLSHLRRFSQPSEVKEPIELLRSGVELHARGFINRGVIQHNLDWVWPYWVNRQFKPQSDAFIPRAASLTQINLSGRNWTAIGLPGFADYPIVDARGLVMPFWDSWSIDVWMLSDEGQFLAPSQLDEDVKQHLNFKDNLTTVTVSKAPGMELQNKAEVNFIDNNFVCCMDLTAKSVVPGWLIISARPYNTEGVSFIHKIEFHKETVSWEINGIRNVFLSESPDKHLVSDYTQGDVSLKLKSLENVQSRSICSVGMATAAAMYRLLPGQQREIKASIPLHKEKADAVRDYFRRQNSHDIWQGALDKSCRISLPYKNYQYLYEAAVRSVVLHSPGEVYPGPFTYKRFWFRDAAFIVYSILCIGMIKRAEKLLDKFPHKQTPFGYFHSQEGEWDSNGQVLWVMNKFCQFAHCNPKDSWLQSIVHGAKWIIHKRTAKDSHKPHAGLLPAGFSAEHLGPNDYYYWDDFWSVAGLRAAAEMVKHTKYADKASEFESEAQDLSDAIDKSLASCSDRLGRAAMPASPYRRLDSGAIGSIAALYPIGVMGGDDERVIDTADYLMTNCIFDGGFFHDITHSGINAYLSLHLAQVLLRINDLRCQSVVESVAELASATGQWPEAINPRTGGGCMGDGQHVWASAEWILMMINSFAMEESGGLVLGAGVFPQWLAAGSEISMGPVTTAYGCVSVKLRSNGQYVTVSWDGSWHLQRPQIKVRLPGCVPAIATQDETSVKVRCEGQR